MDQATLVDSRVEGGRRLVEALADARFPVSIAFWLHDAEVERWILCLASEAVVEEGLRPSLMAVHRLIWDRPDLGIDPFEVELVGPGDPRARAFLGLRERFPESPPTWVGGTILDGIYIRDAYLYPPSAVRGGQPA